MPDEKKESVYFRLEKKYLDQIDTLARDDERSRSYIIRKIVTEALDKK